MVVTDEQKSQSVVVRVGWTRYMSWMGWVKHLRTVSFWGAGLADLVTSDAQGRVLTLKLYRTADGRLLVHSEKIHLGPEGNPRWIRYTLEEVTSADLDIGGKYEGLGWEAKFIPPLSLDEGLALSALQPDGEPAVGEQMPAVEKQPRPRQDWESRPGAEGSL